MEQSPSPITVVVVVVVAVFEEEEVSDGDIRNDVSRRSCSSLIKLFCEFVDVALISAATAAAGEEFSSDVTLLGVIF